MSLDVENAAYGVCEVVDENMANAGRVHAVENGKDIDDIIAEGEKVAVRMTQSGTHTGAVRGILPTGKSFSVDYVHWFRLEDGKVAELWAVRDDLTRLEQLGLTPGLGES